MKVSLKNTGENQHEKERTMKVVKQNRVEGWYEGRRRVKFI